MAQKKEEKAQMPEKKTCFVIMPFSDPEGYELGHFRSIYKYTFEPAIRAAGYEPLRIDDNSVSNLIHGKMMDELINAPMVLCDLSTNNPNVLYELGIRHAFDKPVVLVQEMGQDRIFDIGAITSVEYHPTRLYEEVVEDQQKITEAILQTANARNTYSIMSLAMLQSAQPASGGSHTSEDRVEYLLQEVAQMSRKMGNLEKKFISARTLDMPYSQKQVGIAVESQKKRRSPVDYLRDMVDSISQMLEYEETSGKSLSAADLDTIYRDLYDEYCFCRDKGWRRSELEFAIDMLGRLRILQNNANLA